MVIKFTYIGNKAYEHAGEFTRRDKQVPQIGDIVVCPLSVTFIVKTVVYNYEKNRIMIGLVCDDEIDMPKAKVDKKMSRTKIKKELENILSDIEK
ncbi:MAG: hypothetical protein GY861_05735 [bacterium]|nr:hypothetical protein [bacterium]